MTNRNVDVAFESDASFFFTLDVTEPIPGQESTRRFGSETPISLNVHGTNTPVRAIAIGPGIYPSLVTDRTISVVYDTVATPVFTPAPGDYPTNQSMTISTATARATIRCTVSDGTEGAPTPVPGEPGTFEYTDSFVQGTSVDNSDGNRIPVGTIIVYFTGEGRYGKMLVTVSDASSNHGPTFDYVTCNADGTVRAASTSVVLIGTGSFDLDPPPARPRATAWSASSCETTPTRFARSTHETRRGSTPCRRSLPARPRRYGPARGGTRPRFSSPPVQQFACADLTGGSTLPSAAESDSTPRSRVPRE